MTRLEFFFFFNLDRTGTVNLLKRKHLSDKVLLFLRSNSPLPKTVLNQYSHNTLEPFLSQCLFPHGPSPIYLLLFRYLGSIIRKPSSLLGFLSWQYSSFYALTIMYWFYRSGSPVLRTFYYVLFVLSLDENVGKRKKSGCLIAIRLLFELRWQTFNEMVSDFHWPRSLFCTYQAWKPPLNSKTLWFLGKSKKYEMPRTTQGLGVP